jgi:hypothetical protein
MSEPKQPAPGWIEWIDHAHKYECAIASALWTACDRFQHYVHVRGVECTPENVEQYLIDVHADFRPLLRDFVIEHACRKRFPGQAPDDNEGAK